MKESPEYRALTPRPTNEGYQALKAGIKTNGIHIPLIVDEGLFILDGYSRFDVAKEIGLAEVPIEIMHFDSEEEKRYFVVRINTQRRHLSKFQLAEAAMRLLEPEEERAKERMVKGTLAQNGARGKASSIVARRVGLSTRTFEKALVIIERGPEELKESLRAGKISIDSAYKMSLNPKKNRVKMEVKEGDSSERFRKELEQLEEKIKNEDKNALQPYFAKTFPFIKAEIKKDVETRLSVYGLSVEMAAHDAISWYDYTELMNACKVQERKQPTIGQYLHQAWSNWIKESPRRYGPVTRPSICPEHHATLIQGKMGWSIYLVCKREHRLEHYPGCELCGEHMNFNPASEMLRCPKCGFSVKFESKLHLVEVC